MLEREDLESFIRAQISDAVTKGILLALDTIDKYGVGIMPKLRSAAESGLVFEED